MAAPNGKDNSARLYDRMESIEGSVRELRKDTDSEVRELRKDIFELTRSIDRLAQQMAEHITQLDNLFTGTFQPKSCVEHSVKIQNMEVDIDERKHEIDSVKGDIKAIKSDLDWLPDAVKTMRRWIYGGVSALLLYIIKALWPASQ